MKLNTKKIKVMHIGKVQYKDIEIDDDSVERVPEFFSMVTVNLTDA